MEIIHEWACEWDFFAEQHFPGRTQIFICSQRGREQIFTLGGDQRPPQGRCFKLLLVEVNEEEKE